MVVSIYALLATIGMLILGFAIFLLLAAEMPGKWVVLIWVLNILLALAFFTRFENSQYIGGLYILFLWTVGLVGGVLVVPLKMGFK